MAYGFDYNIAYFCQKKGYNIYKHKMNYTYKYFTFIKQ